MGYKNSMDHPSFLAQYASHAVGRYPAPPEKFQDFIAVQMQETLDFARTKLKDNKTDYVPLAQRSEMAVTEWNKLVFPAGSSIASIAQRIQVEDHILKGLKSCNADALSSATGDPIKDSSLLAATVQKSCKAPAIKR